MINNNTVTSEQESENNLLLDKLEVGERFYAYMPNPTDRLVVNRSTGAIRDPGPSRTRCQKMDDGSIFVFSKGKKKWGRTWTPSAFARTFIIIPKTDEGEAWHKRLRRAIACLEKSGLWPEIRDLFQNLLLIAYADWVEMKNIYWSKHQWVAGRRVIKTEEEMDSLWDPYINKYPFAFHKTADGHYEMEWDYITEMAECRLKSMYFGKLWNEGVKKDLAEHISQSKPYSSGRCTAGYDSFVVYKPEKAWYTEECKTGGEYNYLALDHSTALFVEKD